VREKECVCLRERGGERGGRKRERKTGVCVCVHICVCVCVHICVCVCTHMCVCVTTGSIVPCV